jgi:hypothetical protein
VFFNSDTSNDPEGDKLYYEWYLRPEDGDWAAIGTQATVQRTFKSPGDYQVRLIVTDGKEAEETSVSFSIKKAPDGDGGEDDGLLGGPLVIGILVIVIVVGGAMFLLRSRD